MDNRQNFRPRSLLWLAITLVLALCVSACGKSQQAAPEAAGNEEDTVLSQDASGTETEDETAAEEEKQTRSTPQADSAAETEVELALPEDGTYTSKDEVAWYLHTYGHLPSNYVTKEEAEDAGWKTEGLTVAEACPGKSIGGDRFGNYEKLLPEAKGRTYFECDIDFAGEKKRNAKRLVYSNDGLIFYTDDHFKTFEQLY